MQELQFWFDSGKIYEQGVILYQQLGKSEFLKTVFAQGATKFNKERLEKELRNLLPVKKERSSKTPREIPEGKSQKVAKNAIKVAKNAKKVAPNAKTVTPTRNEDLPDEHVLASTGKQIGSYPDAVKDQIRQANAIYRQAGKMHRELRFSKRIINGQPETQWPYLTKEERKNNALGILELMEKNRELWSRVDYFESTGRIMLGGPEKIKFPEDAYQLAIYRNNIRSNISKWKKNLTSAEDDQRKSYCKKKIEQYLNDLKEAEQKLEGLK
jgi:hypothetical protein